MRPPDAMVSFEERQQVYNEDLDCMAPSELEREIYRAALIAHRNPRAAVIRGTYHMPVQAWASERILKARARLTPKPTGKAYVRPKSSPWVP